VGGFLDGAPEVAQDIGPGLSVDGEKEGQQRLK